MTNTPAHGPHGFLRRIRALSEDRTGSVLVIVSGSIIVLMILLGAAVDSGRAYLLRSKMSNAVDAAALAAGAMAFAGDRTDAELIAEARNFYFANLPNGFLGGRIENPTVVVNRGTNVVTIDVTGNAKLDTLFMKFAGYKDLPVSNAGQVTVGTSDVEIAMVLDNTGSMAGSGKIQALRDSANTLVDMIWGNSATLSSVYMSVVPYIAAVNIGKQRTGWLTVPEPLTETGTEGDWTHGWWDPDDTYTELNGNTWHDIGYNPAYYDLSYFKDIARARGIPAGSEIAVDYTGPHEWKGCVEARTEANDLTDAPPSVEKFPPYFRYRNKFRQDSVDTCTNQDCPAGQGTERPCGGTMEAGNGMTCHGCNVDWVCAEWTHYEAGWELFDPNVYCTGSPILSLTNKKADIQASINSLLADSDRGGTASNQGLLWGWNTISPRWKGLWGGDTPATKPVEYNANNTKKVVIMMTDGVNVVRDPTCTSSIGKDFYKPHLYNSSNWWAGDYTAYEFWHTSKRLTPNGPQSDADCAASTNIATAELNRRFVQICSNMAAAGIMVHTITFQLADPVTQNIYATCAANSGGKYYNSPTNDELKAAFVDIATNLKSLRLSK